MAYVEKDCIFEFQGNTFENGGAVQTETHLVGYPDKEGNLWNWHGSKLLGSYRVVSSWRVFSFVGSTMYQIEVKTVDGVFYTGRGFGAGMSYKGKRKAKQAYSMSRYGAPYSDF